MVSRDGRPSGTPELYRRALGEPFALHLAPAAAPAREVVEGLDLEQAEDLPVPEVFEHGIDDQRGQIEPFRVAAERDLFEQNRGHREEDAKQHRQDEEEDEELDVEDTQVPRE